ncbi:hypothetical protein JST97_26880 [bacterium]|nr:hypothetical protein [bacterium]
MLNSREREGLYQGQFLVGRATSNGLAEAVWTCLREEFGEQPRDFQGPDFLSRLNRARQRLCGAEWRDQCRRFLLEQGLELDHFLLDRFRLRGVAPGADAIPAAVAAFYAHRDCWYANPQAQINLWLPLHDVDGSCSFGFYPEYFQHPVENDSERFDYGQFLSDGGFQSTTQSLVHPRWLANQQPEPPYPVVLKRGEFLLFAASHLHRTLPNRCGRIRFSLDMRLVHREDHLCHRGAPNCDNRSRGDAAVDYAW